IRARGGQPITLTGGTTQTDDAQVGQKGTVKQLLGGLSNTSWRIRERDTIDWVAWTTNCSDAGVNDDATKSSWKTQQGYGNGNDAWRICR
ncbi:hypothetical protein, partial [Salmonella enterica]|uniref:hypothetical protein n=1 Tax=Salmonella enterica TaxID=28901 RepID=UPI001495919D